MSDDEGIEPIRGEEGGTILGPRNEAVESLNPDMLVPPSTDSGTVPNLKMSYAQTHARILSGGWAREITVRELPVATEIAGVNMRLTPGGMRELHWHKEGEWAYMIAGSARITLLDPEGRIFVEDVEQGGLWFFPAGMPHSIQGLEEGCEFLLAFDSGSFSENETFLITDLFDHTPKDVLAKNFGVDESEFDDLPTDVDHTRYMFAADVPPPIGQDQTLMAGGPGSTSYTFDMDGMTPAEVPGGTVRVVDSNNFPTTGISAALLEIEPGAMREIHWHMNDEWQYYLGGQGRMTVFASSGRARTFDYRAGDVGYVPFAMSHYIENTGDETLRMLALFRSPEYRDISVRQWMAMLPPEIVKQHLNLSDEMIAGLPKAKQSIVE
jgi:oxalate decarboxylase